MGTITLNWALKFIMNNSTLMKKSMTEINADFSVNTRWCCRCEIAHILNIKGLPFVFNQNAVSAAEAEIKDGLEISSVSEVGNGDRAEDEEEILPSFVYPLHQKHQHVENNFSKLMDQ